MDFAAWEPFYEQILADFAFSRSADESVAAELDRLLGGRRLRAADLRPLLEGRRVLVAGNAPDLARHLERSDGVLITADEATSVALAKGLRPDVIVTDLDGNVADQVMANAEGTVAVVHGHGDNGPAVRAWAPRFTGRTLATTQSEPRGRLENFGGFTDGDRGVFLADHFGAAEIRLVGFDFEHPSPKDADPRTKQRKLDWAFVLLQSLGRPELGL